jgi:hypothetical protein
VNKGIYEVTEGFLIGGIEFLEASKHMKHSYKVSSQAAEIFKIKLENFNLLLKFQDLMESFKEKKQTIKIISSLLKLNLSVNQKFLNFTNFKTYFQPKVSQNSANLYLDLKKKKFLGKCECENCFKENISNNISNIKTNYNVNCRNLNQLIPNALLEKLPENKKNDKLISKSMVKDLQIKDGPNCTNQNIRKSFFLQKKKKTDCIYSQFKSKIYKKIKNKSRGFSNMKLSKKDFIKAKAKTIDYFNSMKCKTYETENKPKIIKKRAQTGYKQNKSYRLSMSNISKSEHGSIHKSYKKKSRIRLLSTRAMKNRKRFNSEGKSNMVMIHRKLNI